MRVPTLLLLALVAGLAAGERPLFVLLDDSISMRKNDPQRFAVDSVQLAVGAVREGRPLGIVAFGTEVRDLVPTTRIANHPQRSSVRDQLAGAVSFGSRDTFYLEAMNRAFDELRAAEAAPGTRILFFTDGEADEPVERIEARAREFAERGWIIDGLLLNPAGGAGTALSRVTAVTGGIFTRARRAEDLVEYFVRMTATENDYFLLDTVVPQETGRVPVLPGTRNLFYCAVENEAGGGQVAGLAVDGKAVDLADENRVFRYPKPGGRDAEQANIDLLHLKEPDQGTFAATFKGQPRAVYVSLALPLRVETLPLEDAVARGQSQRFGLRLVLTEANPELRQFLLTEARGRASLRLAEGDGRELANLALSPSAADDGSVIHAGDGAIDWPDGVPMSSPIRIRVVYDLSLRDTWSLEKFDSFLLRTDEFDPAPIVTFGSPSEPVPQPLVLATWVGETAAASFPFAVANAKGTQATFSTDQHFAVQRDGSRVAIRFSSGQAGRHRGTVRARVGDEAAKGELAVEGHAYPWRGQKTLALKQPGPTPLATWAPGHPELPAQSLRPSSAEVRDGQGRTARLAIDGDGLAALQASADLPATTLAGELELRYGTLPVKTVGIQIGYEPPSVTADWSGDSLTGTLGPGDRSTIDGLSFIQGAGAPGALRVQVSDLVGPDQARLLARWDLRPRLGAERSEPGVAVPVAIDVFAGEDAIPGPYQGELTIVHTSDAGATTTFTRPVTVEVP